MKNKFQIFLIALFIVFTIFKITYPKDVVFYDKDSFLKYEQVVGNLKPYLDEKQAYTLRKNFDILNDKVNSLKSIQINKDNEDNSNYVDIYNDSQVKQNSINLNKILDDFTKKYLSVNNTLEKNNQTAIQNKNDILVDSYLDVKDINPQIEFDNNKLKVQQNQLNSLKNILSQKDFAELKKVLSTMNDNKLFLDVEIHKSILQILSKYKDLDSYLILNQLCGKFEVLAYYEIENDSIVKKDLKYIPTKAITFEQDKKYKQLVNSQTTLLDSIYQKYFKGFFIFSNGEKGLLSYTCDYQDKKLGYLGIDVDDFTANVSNDFEKSRFYHSVINELSRVILLSANQVDYTKNGAITDIEDFEIIQNLSKKDSYLIQFYTRFWNDILYQDSLVASESLDKNSRNYFYLRHKDEFINEFVSQDPFKDIIESMTRFILEKKPMSNDLKDQKIRFFYEFEEINDLKMIVEKNIIQMEKNN